MTFDHVRDEADIRKALAMTDTADHGVVDEIRHRAKAEAFEEAAEHLERLAELADGPHAGVIALAYSPTAYAFRVRAERERKAIP